MSRRKSAVKREILPDSKYNNLVVAKCINTIMWDGKKEIAENKLIDLPVIPEKSFVNSYTFSIRNINNTFCVGRFI